MENNEDKNKFTIKKVSITVLMELLNEVYQSGADFVDIYAVLDRDKMQDQISLGVPLEYMSPGNEMINPPEDDPVEEEENVESPAIEEYTEEELIELIKNS